MDARTFLHDKANRDFRLINLDISNKCTLQCSKCLRYYYSKNGVDPGHGGSDLTLDTFKIIASYYNRIIFSGQVSDPIINENLPEFLEYCHNKNIFTEVHTAATHKKRDEAWYRKAFTLSPSTAWRFALDGLPGKSMIYRENQDDYFLWDMMLLGKELGVKVFWRHLVFSYNENDLEEAQALADKHDIPLILLKSGRYNEGYDPLRPKNEDYWK